MKVVRPAVITLDALFEELQSCEPHLMEDNCGVRFNLFEMAEAVIKSLLQQVDEAKAERQALGELMEELLPGLCKLVDMSLATTYFGDEPATAEAEKPRHNKPATVISAIIKHEAE